MTATTGEYVFDSTWDREHGRLAILEEAYDPPTLAQFAALDVQPGWTCLEVGAGGGSIARWLSRQVGPTGRVIAADLDTSHLTGFDGGNVDVVRTDLRHDPLPATDVDLVHARLVLGHIPQREQILAALVAALKPGGWLLVEETENFTVSGSGPDLHARVIREGIRAMERAGFDMSFGGRVPALLRGHGLTDITAEGAIPLRQGGSAERTWLLMTFDQMVERGLAFDLPPGAYQEWQRMMTEPDRWLAGLAVVRTRGRMPA